MLKIYGSMLCPDCVECCAELDRAAIEYEFLDFADTLKNLKEFLAIRDHHPLLEKSRREGKLGIPCLVDEDNTVVLDWKTIM